MKLIRNYVFVPSGEAMRGLEVAVATAVVNAVYKTDLTQLGNWRTWAMGIGLAAVVEAVAYIKGKLPPAGPGV